MVFFQAQDALHLGRYGPEGHLCRVSMAALVVDSGIRMCGRCARVAQRQCYGQTVQNSVLRSAEADPHGPDFSAAHGVSPVAVRCQVVDALVAHVVLYMPVVAQRQLLMVQMTSCLSPYSALSLVRQRIHALRQSMELFKGRRIQRYAWFNSGYKFMRQTTEADFAGSLHLALCSSSLLSGP